MCMFERASKYNYDRRQLIKQIRYRPVVRFHYSLAKESSFVDSQVRDILQLL